MDDDRRADGPRRKVMLEANVHIPVDFSTQAQPVIVRDISARGARVQGSKRQTGDMVILERGGHSIPGTVTWTFEDEFGVRFNRPIDVMGVIRSRIVDRPYSDYHGRSLTAHVIPTLMQDRIARMPPPRMRKQALEFGMRVREAGSETPES